MVTESDHFAYIQDFCLFLLLLKQSSWKRAEGVTQEKENMLCLQAETIPRRQIFIIPSNQISYSSTHREKHLSNGNKDASFLLRMFSKGLEYWQKFQFLYQQSADGLHQQTFITRFFHLLPCPATEPWKH